MLIRFLWTLSVHTSRLLRRGVRCVRRWMPTNMLLRLLRTRPGLKWGTPAMLLGVAYLGAAGGIAILVQQGWNPWLYLGYFLCLWNGFKVLFFGPISLVLLARVRIRENRVRRRLDTAAA
jgi:hypothetical protein